MIAFERLSDELSYGAVIRGITLDDIASEENREQLRKLWFEYGLLLFRDTDVTDELHVELSRVFGRLEGHFLKDRIVDGHPELVAFGSDPVKEQTIDVGGRVLIGYIPWHTDFRWMAHPNHGGILRVHKLPKKGGATGFTCMIDAYNRLDDNLKKRIEGLEAVCKMIPDERMIRFFKREKLTVLNEGTSMEALQARPATDFPAVAHPLVRVQPETGRKMLYFTPHNAVSILGLEPDESDALIEELSWVITDPAYAYYHDWKVDDLVLWDNLRMLHTASGVEPGEEREVRRTTIAAPEPTGRTLEEGGWKWEDNRFDSQTAAGASA
ncbi:TauD/TfdA dioxygenase family protein [Novosphingobium pentaromativorans]|uniref:TauD/TfdA-like domain-containing protein n=1 Tax=Novosphingobium pentaromativorans US6-1 TaxID=1088721 RepID=G6EGP2_9SPHN|nr:TauD/TfdA family dioxygenase [Novosphingobium pentaromativorans]AIT82134.1 hypothetical protein JI59_21640 [Novosphingobium pentaromativorans US6-1]EHJ59589.1 hypothetical protein NSU_3472 [Novosphingobium pentaromativorans US6-1]